MSEEVIDTRTRLIRRGSGHSTVRRVKARFSQWETVPPGKGRSSR